MSWRTIIPLLSALCCVWTLPAQKSSKADIARLFGVQLGYYPQEKIYLQFDRNHYVSGDTVWFRAHKVDAVLHTPDTLSRYVYVDLIDPADSLIQSAMLRNVGGIYSGYFDISPAAPSGDYTVRAYTSYMRNVGEDYFFTAPLRISNPYSTSINIDVGVQPISEGRRMKLDVNVSDMRSVNVSRPKYINVKSPGNAPLLHKLDDGKRSITLRLSRESEKNTYLLSYGNRMSKYIEVYSNSSDFSVSFFPEGGYIVPGVSCNIGFKAIGVDGKGVVFTGTVFDSNGRVVVSEIAPIYAGMGTFRMIPESGQSYYAECVSANGQTKRFELPAVNDNAAVLAVNLNAEGVEIKLLTASGRDIQDPLYLAIHSRGIVYGEGNIDSKNPFSALNPSCLPSGVYHAILLNADNDILSERLFFIEGPDLPYTDILTSKTEYSAKERVVGRVRVTDAQGVPLSGNFSMTVTDDIDIIYGNEANIMTELLISSDVRGYVEEPGWYFGSGDPLARDALDALMLTQGWRRYDIPKLMKGELQEPLEPVEVGQFISGSVTSLLGSRPQKNTSVIMISPQSGVFAESTTDDNGRFELTGFEQPDNTRYIVKALSKNGNDNVLLELDKQQPPLPKALPGEMAVPAGDISGSGDSNHRYITKVDEKWVNEHGVRDILIDEITIKAKRMPPAAHSEWYAGLGGKYFDVEDIEELQLSSLEEILQRVAGVRLVYGGSSTKVMIRTPLNLRGSSQAVFCVDGIMMEPEFDWRSIHMQDIDYVEVIKEAGATAIFGIGAGGGVVVVRTKRGPGSRSLTPVLNIKDITVRGYQEPAEFYSPKYEANTGRSRNSDLRTTIFWKPDLKTNSKGEAWFEFWTADSRTTYTAIIEGVTDNGQIVRSIGKIVRD